MKKYLKVLLIIILLILVAIPLSYSSEINKQQKDFFEIMSNEISKLETLEMTLNLESIEYENFEFELTSNINISNIEIDNTSQLGVNNSNNVININIDKTSNSINNINLYYKVSETLNTGDIIKFIATITNCDNDNEKQVIEKQVVIVETVADNEDKKENQSEDEKNNNGFEQQLNFNINKDNDNIQNLQKIDNNIETTSYTMQSASLQSESSINQDTYNGSNNNYLSQLYIQDKEFNKQFSKDCSTYFVTVKNDIEDLEIIATTEDDNANIVIYGNENLNSATNKVLITVTAENGEVRNYRIYVTKNE